MARGRFLIWGFIFAGMRFPAVYNLRSRFTKMRGRPEPLASYKHKPKNPILGKKKGRERQACLASKKHRESGGMYDIIKGTR